MHTFVTIYFYLWNYTQGSCRTFNFTCFTTYTISRFVKNPTYKTYQFYVCISIIQSKRYFVFFSISKL